MSFQKYPEYKDSGVEWLGDVPEHWAIFSLKRSVDGCTNGLWGDEPGGESDIAVIRVADFDRGTSRVGLDKLTYRCITQKERASRLLQPGDLLIEKSGGGEKTLVGCVVLFGHDFQAITSNFVARMRPLMGFDSGFLCYAFDSLYQGKVNYPAIKQTTGIQNLDSETYLQERFCFPPRAEQTQIARFLDHETARIDALIEEQQCLIELLKEKRQAVISHAVTKGLDPSVPMKDSGVEWLGEVPAHWSTLQVGRVCRKVSDGPHFSPDYVDEGVLFLSARNIAVDGWHLEDAKFVSEEDYLEFCRRIIPEKGDVLYTKGGTTGIARVVDLDERFQVWVHVAVLKLDRDLVDPYYMAFSLNSAGCYEQSQLHTRGATNQDLGLTRMTKIWFALPPLEEQTKICDFLNLELGNIDSLSSEATTVMELLTERRSALISAAVTGKIDLRGWQPPAGTPAPLREQETA